MERYLSRISEAISANYQLSHMMLEPSNDPIVPIAVDCKERPTAELNDDENWLPQDSRSDVLPFPLECFPAALQTFAAAVAQSVQCPVDLVAVPMLAVAGAAIGNSRALRLRDGYEESPRMYLAGVAPPGGGKSPALRHVCRPVYEEQSRLQLLYAKKKATYDCELEAYEAARQARARGEIRQPSSGDKPVQPCMQHVYLMDATTEALAHMLEDNPRGLLMIQDELTAWVQRHNQYRAGRGADRQFSQSCWSGEPAKVDRRSADPLIVRQPLLCVVGCIPPERLADLDSCGRGEDGFVHRILFCVPRQMAHRHWDWHGVSPEIQESWRQTVSRLYALEMSTDTMGMCVPKVVNLTDEARNVWADWYDSHFRETEHDDFPAALVGPWSKMVAYAARFALVIQLLRVACGENVPEDVDAESLRRAIRLIDYFKTHARVVYGRLQSGAGAGRVQRVVTWIRAHGRECNPSALVKNNVAGIAKKSEALLMMRDLEDRGYGNTVVRRAKNNRDVVWLRLKRMEASQIGSSRQVRASCPRKKLLYA